MDNKDNELFNGIIDMPAEPQPQNPDQNLEYNFNFETQVETPQVNQQSQEIFNMPNQDTLGMVQNTIETQQIPTQTGVPNQTEVLGMEFQTPQNNVETIQMPTENVEQITEENQKTINEEKLKSLAADTNELVNPNLIVNPALKPIGMQTQTKENSLQQQEEGKKGNYVVGIIIIGLIILFIMFLPKLTELFGL